MPNSASSRQLTHQDGVDDTRPRFGIGHVVLAGADIARLAQFYAAIGLRPVVTTPRFAIVELRGGTHLVFQPGTPGEATLDLIVDDIDETHEVLRAAGGEPGAITRGNPHDRFVAADPEDNTLIVYSDHAIGLV